MRKSGRIAVMLAAVISMATTVTGYAGIEDFLGGAGNQTQTAGSTVTDTGSSTPDTTDGSAASAASQSVSMVTCTDAQTGLDVARAAVPDGYSVTNETSWCGPTASPDYPVSVFVDAISPDGSIELTYESPLQFVQVMDSNIGGMTYSSHVNGQVDPSLHMMMLEYMSASQYLDYVASLYAANGTSEYTLVSDVPATAQQQAQLDQAVQQEKDYANSFLEAAYSQVYGQALYVDQAEASMAERTYRYTDAFGKEKILKMWCIVKAIRTVSSFPGTGVDADMANWVWSVPCRYSMITDVEKEDEADPIFRVFCDNTTVSDQFIEECKKLSEQIMEAVLQASLTDVSTLSGEVQDSFSSDIGGSDDTYSAIEGWDDVIMERNDYTLSNGDSVKVDTSYDYVYELDDNSIYATNSPSDEPAGGTRLYAN